MRLFEEFHLKNSMAHSFNAMFLVLIPKKGRAADVKDFRLACKRVFISF